ncbi:MAG TPA: hypothetical protein VN112_04865 [Ensifer sp.]|nr:hypothetical protein [Ensifer sp.]
MRFRISEIWEKSFHRPGSLGIGITVWAVMLGGVFATIQLNTTHVAADRSYVEQEPAVTASIRQKYTPPIKSADNTAKFETAAVPMPARPQEQSPALEARNIPVPKPRPEVFAIKALPLVAERAAPMPSPADHAQRCGEACDEVAMNAPMSPEEASKLPFDDGPVLEGRVEPHVAIMSDLKHLASETLRPLDRLNPFSFIN